MDKIEVSQRARESAAALWESKDGVVSINANNARLGRMDDLPTVQAFARFERDILATRTDATPVAWMDLLANAYSQGAEDVHKAWIEGTASNEPDFGEAASDYARSIDHPPATDVAALVEAATAVLPFMAQMRGGMCMKIDGKIVDAGSAHHALSAALAPFTKGQNDG